jgi:hypothetical protein
MSSWRNIIDRQGTVNGNLVGTDTARDGNGGQQGRVAGNMVYARDAAYGCRLNQYRTCLECTFDQTECTASNSDIDDALKWIRRQGKNLR